MMRPPQIFPAHRPTGWWGLVFPIKREVVDAKTRLWLIGFCWTGHLSYFTVRRGDGA